MTDYLYSLPVLEAMLAGIPVITSNVLSLPEVAGKVSIARAIRTLDNDEARCHDLAQKGLLRAEFFSPERYQQRLAELYRRVR